MVAEFRVLGWARYTVPVHLVLPSLLFWATQRWPDSLFDLVVGIHVLGAVAIGAGYPWWRGQGEQLAVLILLDHLATGAGAVALAIWRFSG